MSDATDDAFIHLSQLQDPHTFFASALANVLLPPVHEHGAHVEECSVRSSKSASRVLSHLGEVEIGMHTLVLCWPYSFACIRARSTQAVILSVPSATNCSKSSIREAY